MLIELLDAVHSSRHLPYPREVIGRGRTAEVYAWDASHVLKLFYDGLPAEWVTHEAETAAAVNAAKVPAPAVGDVITVEGRLGILYQRVDGPSLWQAIQARPWRIL